jgi:hypothetical protein
MEMRAMGEEKEKEKRVRGWERKKKKKKREREKIIIFYYLVSEQVLTIVGEYCSLTKCFWLK